MAFNFLQRKKTNTQPSIEEQTQKEKILKGVDTRKQQQHDRLMDEFKKVHRKMFKNSDINNDTSNDILASNGIEVSDLTNISREQRV